MVPFYLFALLTTAVFASDHQAPNRNSAAIKSSFKITVPGVLLNSTPFREAKAWTDPEEFHSFFMGSNFWDCSSPPVVNQYEKVSALMRQQSGPSELRAHYETQYSALAKRQLTDALSTGSPLGIASVALKFRFTAAGDRAALMAVLASKDRGFDQSAAYFFNGWFADNADRFCQKKEQYAFVLMGLSLLQSADLDAELAYAVGKVKACSAFSVGHVDPKNLDSHLKSKKGVVPTGRLANEWFESKNEPSRSKKLSRDLLRFALTYGASEARASQLFQPESTLGFCINYDLEASYRRFTEVRNEEAINAIAAMQLLYPTTTSELNQELKGKLLESYYGADWEPEFTLTRTVALLGDDVIPDLIAALSDKSSQKVERALSVFSVMGTKAAANSEALRVITELFERPNITNGKREGAILALGAMGNPGAIKLKHLIKRQPDLVKNALLNTSRLSEETLRVLMATFDESSPAHQLRLVKTMGFGGEKASFSVEKLLTLLDSEDSEIRKLVLEALGNIGPSAESSVPKMILLLKSAQTADLKRDILLALSKMGEKAGPAMSDVLPYLEGEDPVANDAAKVLSAMGVKVIPSLDSILQHSEDSEQGEKAARIRRAKHNALLVLSTLGEAALPSLVRALSDKEVEIARYAAECLGAMRQTAVSTIPQLYAAMLENPTVGEKVSGKALGKIGNAAKPKILEALTSANVKGRRGALYALAYFEEDPDFALPLLSSALKDKEASVRAVALESLILFDTQASKDLPTIVSLASDPSSEVRVNAYHVLANFRNKSSVQALLKGISDRDTTLRQDAYDSLKKIGALSTRAAIPTATEQLNSKNVVDRLNAIKFLSIFNDEAVKQSLLERLEMEKSEEVLQHFRLYLPDQFNSKKRREDLDRALKINAEIKLIIENRKK